MWLHDGAQWQATRGDVAATTLESAQYDASWASWTLLGFWLGFPLLDLAIYWLLWAFGIDGMGVISFMMIAQIVVVVMFGRYERYCRAVARDMEDRQAWDEAVRAGRIRIDR